MLKGLTGKAQYSVTDIDGKQILQGSGKTIDISNAPNGVYYIKLTRENTIEVLKVIKI